MSPHFFLPFLSIQITAKDTVGASKGIVQEKRALTLNKHFVIHKEMSILADTQFIDRVLCSHSVRINIIFYFTPPSFRSSPLPYTL